MGPRRIGQAAIFLFFLFILFICASVSEAAKLKITVNPGKNYVHHYTWGIIPLRLSPQMAFWLEDDKGKFVGNIYITYRSATSRWIGGKGIRRPEALPVWSHAQGIQYRDGLYMPDREHPLPDAVTGATPKGSFIREWNVPKSLPPGNYVIRAEVNSSFDYNETYRKDLSENDADFNGVSGQPSVVYKGEVALGLRAGKTTLSPCGHGHPAGRDGRIYTDMKGITDALAIVESIEVEYVSEGASSHAPTRTEG